jgi:hypothetical protein
MALHVDRDYFIDQHLRAFIANADFGPLRRVIVHPYCTAQPGRLQDYIPTMIATGITTASIVVDLFLIYIGHHRLQLPTDPSMWRTNQEMLDYLGEDFVHLAEQLQLDYERQISEGREPETPLFHPGSDDVPIVPTLIELYELPYYMDSQTLWRLAEFYNVPYDELSDVDHVLYADHQISLVIDDEKLLIQEHVECLRL